MIRTKELNEEVLFTTTALTTVTREDIELLKDRARRNKRRRIRLCAHRDTGHALHEMFIVQTKGIYIPPHRHLGKSESFHVIEGRVTVILFHDDGCILQAIPMGDYTSGRIFYYRMEESIYHSLIVESDFLVFHETGGGPFDPSRTDFAPWAPKDTDIEGGKAFLRDLTERAIREKSLEGQREGTL